MLMDLPLWVAKIYNPVRRLVSLLKSIIFYEKFLIYMKDIPIGLLSKSTTKF
jgi:hypothetical protein